MNKVFEKIIEKLEERQKEYLAGFGVHNNDEMYGIACGLGDAIEIVKQEAEQFGTDINVGSNGWIPCSERLPEERDWYLAVFEEVDTGFIGIPYIADYLIGSHTKFTTEDGWIIRNCSDREDESAEYYKNLRCVAWQRLPEPYKN